MSLSLEAKAVVVGRVIINDIVPAVPSLFLLFCNYSDGYLPRQSIVPLTVICCYNASRNILEREYP